MRTKSGNAAHQLLVDRAADLDKMATTYAVSYAQRDDPADKASFEKYSFAAEQLRSFHPRMCEFLHDVESYLPETLPKGAEQ